MQDARLNVLLVEDSASDAELLEEALRSSGSSAFVFTVAPTLQTGLERLRERRFDVLLLDLTLPDSAGPDTYLRARAASPLIPIVLLTGLEDEAVGVEAVRHGIQDYLIKSQADGRLIARAIRYAIERKQAETALQQERDQLDARVNERTAELLQANRALEGEVRRRQRAEEAHSVLQRRLAEAQETERGRISRELHDELGQELTALKLGLQYVRKLRPLSAKARECLGTLDQQADTLMQSLHRLAWELHPAVLDDFGLEMALRRYTGEWSKLSGVPLDFHSRGGHGDRLPAELETTLYRITQEALTNVLRHAGAHRVSVLLDRRPQHVSLIVEDDGQGFQAMEADEVTGQGGKLGLVGMRERVSLIGGTLHLESSPGSGTTVRVRLPLEKPPAQTQAP